jgi:hypothetical protein
MPEHTSRDTAQHGAQTRRLPFFLDEADGDNLSAVVARLRDRRRACGQGERRDSSADGVHG